MQTVQEQIAFATTHGLFRTATGHQIFLSLLTKSDLYKKLRKASKVDCFISHSWACSRWKKSLAICHHLNYHRALACSGVAAVLAVSILVLSGGFNGVANFSPQQLYVSCVCWPIGAFLLVYLFGHLGSSTSFWLDQVCVDQDPVVKVQTLRAIPAPWQQPQRDRCFFSFSGTLPFYEGPKKKESVAK